MKERNQYVYVFIRQDLPIPLQLVHSCHAIYHATLHFLPESGVPCLVVIGVPDLRSLNRVKSKLADYQLPHFCWDDPDDQDGMLSIATAPLDFQQKNHLSNYRLYSLGTTQVVCGLNGDEGAKADVAQLREQPTFSRERAGENPAVGSNF